MHEPAATGGVRLRVTRSALRTPALALAMLASVLATAELAARTRSIQTRLPAGGVGSPHRQFEVQLAKLERLVGEEGRVDLLFIGSSVVYCGIDPAVVDAAYQQRAPAAGLHGFTFGVNAMNALSAGLMAEVLVHRYHPSLLIYGISPFDLMTQPDWGGESAIEASPWVQYHLGRWSLAGWLTEHSAAYRSFLPHRNWQREEYAHEMWRTARLEYLTSPRGFRDDARTMEERKPRPPIDLSIQPAAFSVGAGAWAGLDRIARLHASGVPVILLEVPVPQSAIATMPGGEQGHGDFIATVEDYAATSRIPFWRTRGLDLVPPNGWKDAYHMNPVGARSFSQWLGIRLAEAGVTPAPTVMAQF